MQNPLLVHHEKMGAALEEGRLPLRFTTIEEEYWAVRKAVGMADLSHLGRLRIAGKDRIPFLNGLLTNDILGVKQNMGVHSVLLNTKARVLADLYIYDSGESLVVDTCDTPGARVKTILDQFIITEDVKIEESTENLLLVTLQGPLSSRTVKEVLGVEVGELRPLQSKSVGPSQIIARDRTGQGGYDILLPRDEAESVWNTFLLQGGELGLKPVGSEALEILRLEKGASKYGIDVDENTIVLEAGFQDAISFTKGCYMGQEVVARATHIGRVNRRLVQVLLDIHARLGRGSELSKDGKPVGSITSSAFSPSLGKVVALGYVQRDQAVEGNRLSAGPDGEKVDATVAKLV
jgi:folate-binding protein YgfZ